MLCGLKINDNIIEKDTGWMGRILAYDFLSATKIVFVSLKNLNFINNKISSNPQFFYWIFLENPFSFYSVSNFSGENMILKNNVCIGTKYNTVVDL